MLKNGLYNFAGSFIRLLLGVLAIPLLIRLLGVEEYGLWMLVSAVMGVVTLAEAGLPISTIALVSRDIGAEDSVGISQTLTVISLSMLVLATIAAAGLWLAAANIVSLFPTLTLAQQAAATQSLQIGGLVVGAQLLQQIIIGVEQAYQQYALSNLCITIQAFLTNTGLLVVAWIGGQTLEMIQWQAITTTFMLALHICLGWSILRGKKIRPRWDSMKARVAIQFSIQAWVASFGSALFSRFDRLLVGGLLGPTVLGVYGAITTITAQINTLSALPVQPLLPALSRSVQGEPGSEDSSKEDQAEIRHQVQQAFQINTILALGMGAGLAVFTPLVIYALLPGTVPAEYHWAFYAATIIYALYSLNAVGYYTLLSVNAVTTCMAVQLAAGVLAMSMIGLLGGSFGLLGAIIGNAGYWLVGLLTYYGMNQLGIRFRMWFSWMQTPFLGFIAVVLVSTFLQDEIISRSILVSVFALFLCWWFVSRQETLPQLTIQRLIRR